MRLLIATLAMSLIAPALVAPSFAAERTLADRYYACLVGYGAVELVYGTAPDEALRGAVRACLKEGVALSDEDGGGMGTAVKGTEDAALAALKKIAA